MEQSAVASAPFQPPSRVDESAREPLLLSSGLPSSEAAAADVPGAKPPPPPPLPPPATPPEAEAAAAAAPAAASQERGAPPGSAPALVRVALLPESNVDFPQITEICERIEAEPAEAAKAVAVLATVLRGRAAYRTKLKALTISHEMLYDSRAVAEFRSVEGFREVLASLRSARDTGLGEPVDQNIRMLATEIDKVCFASDQEKLPTKKNPTGLALKRSMSNLQRTVTDAVDKGVQKIDRTLSKPEVQSAMQGMERNLERAGETIERTAGLAAGAFWKASTKMMQEAERTLSSLGVTGNDSSPSPTTSPTMRERTIAPLAGRRTADPRQPPKDDSGSVPGSGPQGAQIASSSRAGPLSVPEQLAAERKQLENAMQGQSWMDQQMQWALTASLAEASTARDGPAAAAPSSATSAAAAPDDAALVEMVRAAEAREARAREELAKVAPLLPDREAALRRLRQEVRDSNILVSGLTDRISEVNLELKRVVANSTQLSTQLATQKQKLQAIMPTAGTPAASPVSQPSEQTTSPVAESRPPAPPPPPPKQEAG